MSFAKPTQKTETIDEVQRLLCTVPGCGKPWSVKIDKPMCSYHQWKKEPKKTEMRTVNSYFNGEEF